MCFQTPAHDRCAPARAHPPEPAGDPAAEPSDLLQRCSGCPGAAAAAGFPLRPPEGTAGLSTVLHQSTAGRMSRPNLVHTRFST